MNEFKTLTDQDLQDIITKSKSDPYKWASYFDMKQVEDDVMNAALEASYEFCYDAANLVFTLHSSTSGMYASWHVSISMDCTVYINRMKNAPTGIGNSMNAALADFALRCREAKTDREAGKNETR